MLNVMRSEPEGVVELVDRLLRRAIEAGASDVHLEPDDSGLRVRFRIDGMLESVEILPRAIAPNIIARLKVLSGLLTYSNDTPQEGAIAGANNGFDSDIRVSTFPTISGERAVLRLLANARRLLELHQLGLAEDTTERLKQVLSRPQGLIVLCGPAGSGKSTTLYAMLRYLAASRPQASLISVEDPVELRLDGITQVQIQPARGMTYPIALRSLLRQDPQIIMIGEVRDAAVAETIIDAALTGHLVLTSMHSGSVPEAIIRLREMGVPPYQLTSALQAVLAQRLVRRCNPNQPGRLAGRIALGHLVEMNDSLRGAILAGVDARQLSHSDCCAGSLREDALRHLNSGSTTIDEIRRVIGDE